MEEQKIEIIKETEETVAILIVPIPCGRVPGTHRLVIQNMEEGNKSVSLNVSQIPDLIKTLEGIYNGTIPLK